MAENETLPPKWRLLLGLLFVLAIEGFFVLDFLFAIAHTLAVMAGTARPIW